ncbi:protein of unknown function [Gillisia sp. Hel1_33_143]|uniref:DUF4856 domain-containing protein n=1 Tax=Gillisia sp. Hel1_33_143 TaxID=1336796 RepID=UPI00087ADA75|nr:DUF4856 domain-containing protein [Gillisia sp. Hel1_33_143]SDR66258.1 protein of unknown function [Gillisia sp. Hel1_33_143]
MKKFALIAFAAGLTLSSCSSDDDVAVTTENPIIIPQNYTFERGTSSTVNYEGQTTRLEMSAELLASFNDFDNASEQTLANMFSNENAPFSSAALNTSSKSIKSKVAASTLYFSANTVESAMIKNDFDGFIQEQMNVVKSNKDQLAEPGKAGQVASGSKERYVNGKGLELNQAFAKSLIGGLVLDQILNNYLSTGVLDEGDNRMNNEAEIVEEGTNYTSMEHKWDEAYGYLYGNPSIPSADPNSVLNESDDHLLFNYLGEVDDDEDFSGLASSTFEAFKKGRAAIVAEDYAQRDLQAEIIKENLSKVIAVRAVHYLQGGKNDLAEQNYGSAFHALSEGYGFIYSLRFTNNPVTNMPYITKAQVDSYKEQLLAGNGFWDVNAATLDTISEEIASAFGFSVMEAAE